MNQSRGPLQAMPCATRVLVRHPQNTWFRVSERAVKIEYGRPAHHHVISIACGQAPGIRGLVGSGREESSGRLVRG